VTCLALANPAVLGAATIRLGNVTTTLGPTFFIDDAVKGGTDTDIDQPNVGDFHRNFNGLLTRNQGPTRVTLTGFGFAAHTSADANDATSLAVSFTYLGADEAIGGSDDVSIGTATGNYTFTAGGEYVFAFDTPLSANLTITGTRFRTVVTPTNLSGNGSLKLKTSAISYESTPTNSATLSIAGVSSPQIVPQRVNLAKYQTLTASSVNGNRLATYATDGDAGNDSHWQSQSWAYNNGRIDFPFPVEIGSAQVFMGIDDTLPLAKLGIQYLVGSTWTTIPDADISNNTNVERNLVFATPVTATSFRITVTDPVIRLREWALYPPNGPGGYPLGTDIKLNLALQRPAVASSHTTGNFPINAVDGRTHAGSSWQTTTNGVNTLDIEMVANTKIGSVHLYSGSGTVAALGDFALKSWNGTAWVDIPGGVVTGNTQLARVITFTTPPTTTRVRLEFTLTGARPTVIRELQIFPANTGNVGYALGTNINPSGAYARYEDFSDAFYQITNVGANRDVAVATGGGPALEPAGMTAAQAQYQVLLNLSDGTYRLRNRDTGECLSGARLSKTAGEVLTDEPYLAMPHQDWILEPLGGGRYRITNAWSGLAIDTQGGATAPGTALVQNTVSNATSQQWRFNFDTWAPKKGLGHGLYGSAFNVDWLYRWGPNRPTGLSEDVVFHPMQWGSFNWTYNTGSGPIWQRNSEWRKSGDGVIMMGFNEPDRTEQANIPVATAVNLWPQMMALNQPLLGPSPADDGTWIAAFTTDARNRGFRWEYTAIHAYPGPGGSSDGLINDVQRYFNNYGLPVWLTEFSFVDWGKNQTWSEEDCYQTLAEFLWRAEGFAPLRKYALFVFTEDDEYPMPPNSYQRISPAPRSNTYDRFGNLTAFGKLYAGWDGDATIRAGKSYMIHNRNLRKRMDNPGTGNTNPGGRTIRTDGPTVDWTLVSTGVANRYYIVSSVDGRRLSHTSGSGAPTLAASGTTGVNVEWSLTSTATQPEKGWYYIGHPGSNLRLRLASYNTSTGEASYQMVAATTTDENVQWRFIVPLPATTVPTVAPIPDQAVNELTALTFNVSATNSNVPPLPLVYSIISYLFNSSIDSATGVFRWTPTETQGDGLPRSVTIRVSDGRRSTDQIVTLTGNEVNLPPSLNSIGNRTVSEGSPLTFTASASDADIPGNTLTFSLINPPGGATITSGTSTGGNATTAASATSTFNWTPSELQGPGTFTLTVRVNDGTANRDQTVTVTVNEANVAPVLASIAPQSVNEGALLNFTARATDADFPANPLTYSLVNAPTGAAIIGTTGVFSWTPTEAQGPGSYNFTVRVSDGNAIHDQPVSVTVNEANVAPVLAAIPPQTVGEGVLLTFTAAAMDTDVPSNTLTYSLIGAPVGAEINGNSGLFTWTPTEAQGPGNYNFTVRVSDGSATRDQPVAVTVNEANVAPVLAAIPPQTVGEGVLLTFTAIATDTDVPSNTLTYSLIGAPVGAEINGNSGLFTWTLTEAQGPAGYNFTLRVSDGSATHDQAVAVTVTATNPLPSATADLDGDGIPDLLEHAFGTDHNTPNSTPFRVIGANSTNITLQFPWNWQDSRLTWEILHSNSLTNPASWLAVAPGTTTVTRQGNTDLITVTPAMTPPGPAFFRLKVIAGP